jgi:hypothetical protein
VCGGTASRLLQEVQVRVPHNFRLEKHHACCEPHYLGGDVVAVDRPRNSDARQQLNPGNVAARHANTPLHHRRNRNHRTLLFADWQ